MRSIPERTPNFGGLPQVSFFECPLLKVRLCFPPLFVIQSGCIETVNPIKGIPRFLFWTRPHLRLWRIWKTRLGFGGLAECSILRFLHRTLFRFPHHCPWTTLYALALFHAPVASFVGGGGWFCGVSFGSLSLILLIRLFSALICWWSRPKSQALFFSVYRAPHSVVLS